MKAVNITKNAMLIRDSEGYWLVLETSAGEGLFNLSRFTDPTDTEQAIKFNDVLEAYIKDQAKPQPPRPGSQN